VTSRQSRRLADKVQSHWGHRAGQGQHGTVPPRSRREGRPWWRLRSLGRKPRERWERRWQPSFPNVVGPTRALRPAGGRRRGLLELRARSRDRCHGRVAAMSRAPERGDQRSAWSPSSRSPGAYQPTSWWTSVPPGARRSRRSFAAYDGSEATELQMMEPGRADLARFECPKGIRFRDNLDRTAAATPQEFWRRAAAAKVGNAGSAEGPSAVARAWRRIKSLIFPGISRPLRRRRVGPAVRNRP
jgi:hypothetical protein